MSVKTRVLKIGRAISGGDLIKNHPELLSVIGCAINFVLGLLMSTVRVFGFCAPFGIGMVAESGAGIKGLMSLLGACAGYIITGGFDWGIKYVASAVLVYTASYAFQELKIHKTQWFMPCVAGAITAVTGFLNSFELAETVPAAVMIISEPVLAGGSAYFFKIALTPGGRMSEASQLKYAISALLMISCLLMSISRLEIMDVISIGRLIAVLIVMTVSYKGNMTTGCAAGASLGIAMDISAGSSPFYSMAYAFSGLLSGVFSRHSRLIFVLSYILANAVSVLWTWGDSPRLPSLYETFAASVIFMILPGRLFSIAGVFFQQVQAGNGEAGLRRYSAGRVEAVGEAFRDLYELVRKTLAVEQNDNDISSVFDRAADIVCVKCKNSSICWNRDYMDTLSAMNDATKAMLERGRLDKKDLPRHFLEKCSEHIAFITAVNGELRGLMFRRQYKSRLNENRLAAYGQYADMSAIFESVASELNTSEGPDPLAERRLKRYLNGKDIEADVSVFRDRGGRLRASMIGKQVDSLRKEEDYLDKLSAILGVRLCCPAAVQHDEGSLVVMQAEPLAVSVGIAAMKKKGESISGDKGTYFKTDQGVLCVILSDGMGSGECAAKESIAAVGILESFLRAGVDPATAMRILNSVMLLKNGEDWGYVTMDLVCVDLFSGETSFYKYGAAPSYIKYGRIIRRIRGESLAAGICAGQAAAPDIIRMRLRPGNIALIASDGVLSQEDDSWLRGILSGFSGNDTKSLARQALKGAMKEYGCEDDMTVLAIHIDKRL